MKMVMRLSNALVILAEIPIVIATAKDANGALRTMTDQDRFENAEDVRNYYRDQGAERERERIIKLLQEIQDTTNNAKIYCDVLIDLIKGVRDEA